LLADVNQEIDNTLWSAVRAIEERILLLKEISQRAKDASKESARRALEQANEASKQLPKVRDICSRATR
jgi:two-component system, chemotaxis family, protein-glutamate methylesterase/glutaminase